MVGVVVVVVVVVDVVVVVEVVVELVVLVVVGVCVVVGSVTVVGSATVLLVGPEVAFDADVGDVTWEERVQAAATNPIPATNTPRSNALRPSGASTVAGDSDFASGTRSPCHVQFAHRARPLAAIGPVQPAACADRNKPDFTASAKPVAGNTVETSSAVSYVPLIDSTSANNAGPIALPITMMLICTPAMAPR